MITVNILENSDTIRADDWVRQLSLIYTGQSDYLATNNTYSGLPMNRLGWLPARIVCPAWIGKTVNEFRNAVLSTDRQSIEISDYEFVRGPVPNSHREILTPDETKISKMVYK